ncbi:molybdopterin-guanine dinucleotide biosynthesis protein MobB [Endothiovibrio diazotrophicus]
MHHPPLLGFAAYSGTGKTTLLEQLIPRLKASGLRIGLIKQTHHDFEIDHPGKDSHRLRVAGAAQTLIASSRRWALIGENGEAREPQLPELVSRLDGNQLDLILVEGFKHQPFPKIELHRPDLGREPLHPHDPSIIAVATDRELKPSPTIPVLTLNDPDQITRFILAWHQRIPSE